ncbi:PREDICTED: flavonol sulfotransferase-like [Ipomoea nil]|uniref:flavonol sulfotransferase-like n=1 Tax=Ipomoea nil TaxID=35883 RepID=UPI000900F34A|nr:PREDICTED: flavonol sulfotransferase-like [Ipomoea nil]XP_019189650.1 PREDICTED: flavonol sulfotransferase-like [Ipomoea nil]
MKYQEIIASLPKKEKWSGASYNYEYQGFWFSPFALEGIISVQQSFQAQPSDILLCSAPKTGTTWLKALAFAIVTRNQFDDNNNHPLFNAVPHDCVPFLEVDLVDHVEKKKDPEMMPLLSTHLPFSSLPKSIVSRGCKMVYICRDPKDTFVSYWHYLQRAMPGGQHDHVVERLSLEKEFESFCDGSTYYGPYWDHVLGYWKASIERPDSVLFLKYEDLKRDTVFYVRKLGEFMGRAFTAEEERRGAAERIVELCSLEKLSGLEVNKSGKHRQGTPMSSNNYSFFRRGIVGDWKNLLTPEMQRRIDEITEQKLHGSGFSFS